MDSSIHTAGAVLRSMGLDVGRSTALWTEHTAELCLGLLRRASPEGVDRLEAVLTIADPRVRIEALEAVDLGQPVVRSELPGAAVARLPPRRRARLRVTWSGEVWPGQEDILTELSNAAARWWRPAAFEEVEVMVGSSPSASRLALVCVESDEPIVVPAGGLRVGDGELRPTGCSTEPLRVEWAQVGVDTDRAELELRCLQPCRLLRVFCDAPARSWTVDNGEVPAIQPCPLFPELWLLNLPAPAVPGQIIRVRARKAEPDDRTPRVHACPVVIMTVSPSGGPPVNVLAGQGVRITAAPTDFRPLPPWTQSTASGDSGLAFVLKSRCPAVRDVRSRITWCVDARASVSRRLAVSISLHDPAVDQALKEAVDEAVQEWAAAGCTTRTEVSYDHIRVP
jgi:hypothetical protein